MSGQRHIWAPVFHFYQPPGWSATTVRKVARESYRPFLRILDARPYSRVTLNITASLTEQLVDLRLTDIIDLIRSLAERDQI